MKFYTTVYKNEIENKNAIQKLIPQGFTLNLFDVERIHIPPGEPLIRLNPKYLLPLPTAKQSCVFMYVYYIIYLKGYVNHHIWKTFLPLGLGALILQILP